MNNVYNRIPQIDTPTTMIPIYGRTVVAEDGTETYPIIGQEEWSARELEMDSLATQWRMEWQYRTARARRRGVELNAPRMRAPQSFIDTGIWPTDVPRPMGGA